MEIITQKTISIEFEGKQYVLPAEITIGMFLVHLGLPEDTQVIVKPTVNGFSLIQKSKVDNR